MESQKYEQHKSPQDEHTQSNSWGRAEPGKKSGTREAFSDKFKEKPGWESQGEKYIPSNG
jgi:hypothetical protein